MNQLYGHTHQVGDRMVLQRLSFYAELFTVASFLGRLSKYAPAVVLSSVFCWVQSGVALTTLFITGVCELSPTRHVQVYIRVTGSPQSCM